MGSFKPPSSAGDVEEVGTVCLQRVTNARQRDSVLGISTVTHPAPGRAFGCSLQNGLQLVQQRRNLVREEAHPRCHVVSAKKERLLLGLKSLSILPAFTGVTTWMS